jgi:hypothetical protein
MLDSEVEQGNTPVEEGEAIRKGYGRGRSARTTKRRSSRRAGSHPDLGISARRNRRFSW